MRHPIAAGVALAAVIALGFSQPVGAGLNGSSGATVIKGYIGLELPDDQWSNPNQGGQGRTIYECKNNDGCEGVIYLVTSDNCTFDGQSCVGGSQEVPLQFSGFPLYFFCQEGSEVVTQGEIVFLPETCDLGVG